MKTPTEFELDQLMHRLAYDPVAAREYYLRTRKLKGRKKGSQEEGTGIISRAMNRATISLEKGAKGQDPRTGKRMDQIKKEARAKQRKELVAQINSLEGKLKKLQANLAKLIREEKAEDREGKAKKERAAKEADKPKSAAEKAEAARESKKDRAKNQQKNKERDKKDSKEEKAKKGSAQRTKKISSLKATVTKTKGKLAVAKQKLAAL